MKQPFYVLDGYSLIYRSYFAFIRQPLFNPMGNNSSAVFGFFRTLFSFFQEYQPQYFAVALDSIEPTFRHLKYPEYKATRDKTPEDLHAQVPVVEEILDALGIRKIRLSGFEADDIMATFAEQCRAEDRECFIMTGDKDLMQLVDGPVKILLTEKSSYTPMGRKEVFDKFGVYPEQVGDYLSLTGDQSDNIPGVKGIGPKTAVTLLSKYKTLDGVYEHLDELKENQRRKLEDSRHDAYASRDLVMLKDDLDLQVSIETCSVKTINKEAAVPIFLREGMNSIVKDLGGEELLGSGQDSISDIGKKYELIIDESSFRRWISEVQEKKWFAFDCETTSLDSLSAVPVGFSLCTEPGKACYIPMKAPDTECLPEETIKKGLRTILQDESLRCIGQNIKYDYKVCARWGVPITNIAFDTMIAAWLLESNSTYGMDRLAERYLNYRTIHFDEVVPKGETFDTVPAGRALDYAAEDADITMRLYLLFQKKLEEQKLLDLMKDMEIPLIRILADMELEGIRVDKQRLSSYSGELAAEIAETEDKIYTLCGEIFNINSTKQLQEILFAKRKLQPVKKTKTGYSTDNYVLEELAREDPVPRLVLRYRTLSKLKSTYVDSLPKLINPYTGRIHTHFMQTGTATGRLSSRDPNLQNIPIKTEEGRRIRGAFIPKDGSVFISADYSQIELVVLAHLSEDPALCRAFQEGVDVHRRTGSLIFQVEVDDVTPEQRRISKVINFGIMYGMSGFRLSRELNIPRQQAEAFISSYFTQYAGIKTFIEKTVKEAEKSGYAKTMFGRARFIPGITSKNRTEKMAAERAAVNTPIQGTAADIVKLAMLRIQEQLRKTGPEARLLLQVHDELIFEVPESGADGIVELIRREMESVVSLSVPLRVGIETGKSWGDLH